MEMLPFTGMEKVNRARVDGGVNGNTWDLHAHQNQLTLSCR